MSSVPMPPVAAPVARRATTRPSLVLAPAPAPNPLADATDADVDGLADDLAAGIDAMSTQEVDRWLAALTPVAPERRRANG